MPDETHVPDLDPVVGAAIEDARRREVSVSIAVVDAGRHLLRFARMNGVHFATVEVAQAKARSAAAFRGRRAASPNNWPAASCPFWRFRAAFRCPGGIPLSVDGRTIGAVGISGAARDVDEAIARTAAGTAASERETS